MNSNDIFFQGNCTEVYFETIKCDDFEVYNLEYHKNRMADTVGLNFNLEEYIYPPDEKLYRCKVLYNEEEIIDIQYHPYTQKIQKTFKLIYDNIITYKYKSTNRDKLDKLFEKTEGCDDIIIVTNGLLTDTTIANIAVKLDGVWYTPKTPLLKGTTRARLLESKKLVEKDIDIEFLKKADKFALMNAMIDFKIIEDFSIN
ncbi:MAG: aminotransferase class IV [Campylobacterota bacterium]|nr:aminotransferase class IV [Campylobacterota bacterium]